MAKLPESATWEEEVYQIEKTNPVEGGPDGISNQQAKQLANRTVFLKQELEKTANVASTAIQNSKKSDSTTSDSSDNVATSKAVKVVNDSAKLAMGEALKKQPKFTPSDTVTSTSTTQVANVYGVKKAYDKGANAENLANNAQSAVNALEEATLKYKNGIQLNSLDDLLQLTDGIYQLNSNLLPRIYGVLTVKSGTISTAKMKGNQEYDGNWKTYIWNATDGTEWISYIANQANDGFKEFKRVMFVGDDDIYVSKEGLIGVPIPYPSNSVPTGYLPMKGQAISASAYPKLYALYGGRLPDMRGEFIRGWDNGRGVDSGRGIRSWQGDAIRNITGYFPTSSWATTPDNKLFKRLRTGEQDGDGSGRNGYIMKFDASQVVPTSRENRPRNIAFQYICLAG